MNIAIDCIKVKIKFIEEKKIKAIISIDFGDLVIRGFRVMDSTYENMRGKKLWFIPPSYRDGGGKYHPMFFMPKKELWEELESKVWDEYDRRLEDHYKKRFDMPSNTNIDHS